RYRHGVAAVGGGLRAGGVLARAKARDPGGATGLRPDCLPRAAPRPAPSGAGRVVHRPRAPAGRRSAPPRLHTAQHAGPATGVTHARFAVVAGRYSYVV